jgi:hypothetical protein
MDTKIKKPMEVQKKEMKARMMMMMIIRITLKCLKPLCALLVTSVSIGESRDGHTPPSRIPKSLVKNVHLRIMQWNFASHKPLASEIE